MPITCDWHIHTHYSPECTNNREATLAQIAAEIDAACIRDYGFTDHLHAAINIPALDAGRREFDTLPPSSYRHFGVEVSCLRTYDHELNVKAGNPYGQQPDGPEGPYELCLPKELLERLGVSYVIGGAHWPLGVPQPLDHEAVIRCYHRQNMFLATHPRIDIVAHPWWWMGAWQEADGHYRTLPWLDDFRRIPASMHDEFAAAAVQHGKAVEINAGAILLNPQYPASFRAQYLDYLAALKARGVRFSLGSDSHAWCGGYPGYGAYLHKVAPDLDVLGLAMEDLWRPSGPPLPSRFGAGSAASA